MTMKKESENLGLFVLVTDTNEDLIYFHILGDEIKVPLIQLHFREGNFKSFCTKRKLGALLT